MQTLILCNCEIFLKLKFEMIWLYAWLLRSFRLLKYTCMNKQIKSIKSTEINTFIIFWYLIENIYQKLENKELTNKFILKILAATKNIKSNDNLGHMFSQARKNDSEYASDLKRQGIRVVKHSGIHECVQTFRYLCLKKFGYSCLQKFRY